MTAQKIGHSKSNLKSEGNFKFSTSSSNPNLKTKQDSEKSNSDKITQSASTAGTKNKNVNKNDNDASSSSKLNKATDEKALSGKNKKEAKGQKSLFGIGIGNWW